MLRARARHDIEHVARRTRWIAADCNADLYELRGRTGARELVSITAAICRKRYRQGYTQP